MSSVAEQHDGARLQHCGTDDCMQLFDAMMVGVQQSSQNKRHVRRTSSDWSGEHLEEHCP